LDGKVMKFEVVRAFSWKKAVALKVVTRRFTEKTLRFTEKF